MIVIVAVDDKMGMLFNKRRVSQDSVLRAWMKEYVGRGKLYVNTYSEGQFKEDKSFLHVSDNYLEEAGPGDVCFLENDKLLAYKDKIEKLIVAKWNRKYPSDFKLDLVPSGKGKTIAEFEGSSHEKITIEEYVV